MPEHYRQGDLLFVRFEGDVPKNAHKQNNTVIVRGETTGHAHRLQTGTILKAGGALYLDITEQTQVVHEEHAAVTLGPGLWLVVRQREYAPEAIRTVVD